MPSSDTSRHIKSQASRPFSKSAILRKKVGARLWYKTLLLLISLSPIESAITVRELLSLEQLANFVVVCGSSFLGDIGSMLIVASLCIEQGQEF